ncbi:hypothetical protein [Euzebya sp.]|uniref:FitA-like ribbon-helix-helix domain-containing protein n=1 Tax=Euzebya sp. TaxID=1971409 RepID=UPI00355A6A8C
MQASCLHRSYPVCMAVLHVRDVPDETMAALKQKSARAGQSVQAFVRQLLDREAAIMSPEEVAERARQIASRSAVTRQDVLDAIDAARRRET